ncbi:hypothetical protein ACHHYP_11213 [Achlya hypogyna]|uniref:Transmembrane protein n=1 Tax=Achlya hypogyna TaxID=1202772 RepID=A0A1V9YJH5_ACHHY|nr:hypothetical protein ACHHYP_11213 [Achlya hypogyna]
MQFATDSRGAWQLLQYPLLTEVPSWTFFGSILLFDWIEGVREVVSFEGDTATLVLISDAYDPVHYTTSGADRTLEYATMYVWQLLAACNFAFIIAAAITCRAVVVDNGASRNFLFFNRLLGSVWIGRPFCFVRGLSAMAILSTAPLTLMRESTGSRLASIPRPLWMSILFTGEATWIVYVLQDVCLIIMNPGYPQVSLPVGSLTAWLLYLVIERFTTVAPEGSLDRRCTSQDMDAMVQCTSGELSIGCPHRVALLLAVAFASLLVQGSVDGYYRHCRKSMSMANRKELYLCRLSGALLSNSHEEDTAALCLSGVVTWTLRGQRHQFDIKTWTFLSHKVSAVRRPSAGLVPVSTARRWIDKFLAVAALLYIVGSITASISYVNMSRVNLANDFNWAGFNSTGTHVFLATWLYLQLALNATLLTSLAAPAVNLPQSFAAPFQTISPPLNYAARLQHTTFSTQLDEIVRGLRATDACDAPWIFTPYCYLDFQQTWPMANSAKRQQRCASMTTNGAVFLESLLRNVHADDWRACWGDAFQIAVADDLTTSASGAQWLEATLTPQPVAVAIEVAHWQRHGIRSYDTQWQNYKQLGILNSYDIVSCYGAHYPFTLQSQNGSFRVQTQSSWKMYWSLANDLAAVATNGSGMAGLSLLRTSARYAFANQSLQNIFERSNTLVSPLTQGFQLIRMVVGPFGSIDTVYIPVPSVLRRAVAELSNQLKATLRTSMDAQIAFMGLVPIQWVAPVPLTWLDMYASTAGGSPLCPYTAAVSPLDLGLPTFFSYSLPCNTNAPYVAALNPTMDEFVIAAAFARPDDASRVCALAPPNAGTCSRYLPPIQLFAATYLTPPPAAIRDATTALKIELMSYLQVNATTPVVLRRLRLLEEPDFEMYSWLYLLDWVLGLREVVSFEGDAGTIKLLSELQKTLPQQIETWQVATNVALYARVGVLYITFVMIGVASVTSVYMVWSRGAFQWLNMLELCRVGGIVWVGRPLLLLRSMTALSVLSTAAVSLEYDGAISYFQEARAPWYTTVLAAGEVTWLVAVVNDVAMAVTQEYTGEYATINSILVWSTVALLSLVSPVTHAVSLAQTCHLEQVDFQMTCQSGTIVIGQPTRYLCLVGIVVSWNLTCYWVCRWRRQRPPASPVNSPLLSCGATYLFEHSMRTYVGVYYLDRASAVLTGLLSYRLGYVVYVFDIKLWRCFALQAPPNAPTWAPPLRHALPLMQEIN